MNIHHHSKRKCVWLQSKAIKQYCKLVDELVGSKEETSKPDTTVTSNNQYKEIVVTDNGGARTILLNRPAKYNAINYQVVYNILYAHTKLFCMVNVYRCTQRCSMHSKLQVMTTVLL